MKQETYPEARKRLFAALLAQGWTVRAELKRPWAEPKDKSFRVWFNAQAVYRNDHSLFCDIRGMSAEKFVSIVTR